MGFFSKVTSAVLLGSLTLGGAVSMAQQVVSAETLQRLKLEKIASDYAGLKDEQAKLVGFNKDLATATEIKGGVQVFLRESKNAVFWSSVAFWGGILGRGGLEYVKDEPRFSKFIKPTNKVVIIAGVVMVVAVVTEAYGDTKITLSNAQYAEAQNNASMAQGVLDNRKQVILAESLDLGAKVNQNIVSFEGVPQGVKVLGSGGLNLNDLSK